MRLEKIIINNFRSIEKVELTFPINKPLVLFGANNTGKSNILHGIEILLGEKWPANYDFLDSDYFFRDKENYPTINFGASFDSEFYHGNNRNPSAKYIYFSTNIGKGEHFFHYDNDEKMYISRDDREKCQVVLIDATRDMSRQLSYFSQYSMLSRMSKKMHNALIDAQKAQLDENHKNLKSIFETVPEYQLFMSNLKSYFSESIEGFIHRLEIDLSAYDPNNYFNALRIIAKEGEDIRAFDEFGTGEQQILLMAFMNAYARTFTNESFILAIEEPEAHLHPLAQQWLAKNICNTTLSGVQIIISTHSPYFLNIASVEGFVRVYKEDKITKVKQITKKELVDTCIALNAPKEKVNEISVINFYTSTTFNDHLIGFFSSTILLVEGESEYFAFPNYFNSKNYDLDKKGIQIVNCHGKNQIARIYRLFKTFNYHCFAIFDADENNESNEEIIKTFKIDISKIKNDDNIFTVLSSEIACFGKDFETYMCSNFTEYHKRESVFIGNKPLKAKCISETREFQPGFIELLIEELSKI